MKLLIETTAAHMYLDPNSSQEVNAFRPSVVEQTQFINLLQSQGKVTLISAKLKDSASDQEFAKYLKASDGDKGLAISSFLKAIDPVEKVEGPAPANVKPAATNINKA